MKNYEEEQFYSDLGNEDFGDAIPLCEFFDIHKGEYGWYNSEEERRNAIGPDDLIYAIEDYKLPKQLVNVSKIVLAIVESKCPVLALSDEVRRFLVASPNDFQKHLGIFTKSDGGIQICRYYDGITRDVENIDELQEELRLLME